MTDKSKSEVIEREFFFACVLRSKYVFYPCVTFNLVFVADSAMEMRGGGGGGKTVNDSYQ